MIDLQQLAEALATAADVRMEYDVHYDHTELDDFDALVAAARERLELGEGQQIQWCEPHRQFAVSAATACQWAIMSDAMLAIGGGPTWHAADCELVVKVLHDPPKTPINTDLVVEENQ